MKIILALGLAWLTAAAMAEGAENPYQASTADPYALHSKEVGKDKPVHAEEKDDVDFLQGS